MLPFRDPACGSRAISGGAGTLIPLAVTGGLSPLGTVRGIGTSRLAGALAPGGPDDAGLESKVLATALAA